MKEPQDTRSWNTGLLFGYMPPGMTIDQLKEWFPYDYYVGYAEHRIGIMILLVLAIMLIMFLVMECCECAGQYGDDGLPFDWDARNQGNQGSWYIKDVQIQEIELQASPTSDQAPRASSSSAPLNNRVGPECQTAGTPASATQTDRSNSPEHQTHRTSLSATHNDNSDLSEHRTAATSSPTTQSNISDLPVTQLSGESSPANQSDNNPPEHEIDRPATQSINRSEPRQAY